MVHKRLPVFPLGSVVFPNGLLALRIFEKRYIDMIRDCARHQSSFVVTVNQASDGVHGIPHDIGTRVDIVDFNKLSDGLLGITVRGKEKVSLSHFTTAQDGLISACITCLPVDTQETLPNDYGLLSKVLKKMFPEIQAHYGAVAHQYLVTNYHDAAWVGARLVEVLPIDVQMKVELLRLNDSRERIRIIYEALGHMQIL